MIKAKKKISLGLLTISTLAFYAALTLFDIVGDYVIFHLITTGPYDGAIPSLGYVLRETYDDFMLLNLIAPILIGLVGTFLTEIKMNRIN